MISQQSQDLAKLTSAASILQLSHSKSGEDTLSDGPKSPISKKGSAEESEHGEKDSRQDLLGA